MTGDAPHSVWLLSAYQADSHQAWSQWLINNVDLPWQLHSLPGRYFRWRIRGNPLSWLDVLPSEPPAHLLATSMVDLATLKGIMPALAGVPTSLYFHENQFAYPVSGGQHNSVDPLMVQLYSALASDELLFNSQYNRDSFVQGIDALLAKMPDHVPSGIGERLLAKSHILPVPVASIAPQAKRPLIVWPHRWEYDKAPERFEAILTLLASEDVPFELALLGARGKKVAAALANIRRKFAGHIVADGRVSRAEYEILLGQAKVVISTAIHEFQGLAMLEAVSAGAVPVVPDALCYPEQYPAVCRFSSDADAVSRIKLALAGKLPAPNVSAWLEGETKAHWQSWANKR